MKQVLFLAIGLVVAWSPQWLMADSTSANPPSATFISVTGKVTVKDKKGKVRPALKNSQAFEGETVKVDSKGAATLQLFDGSTLNVSPDTEVLIKTLQKPTKDEKKIRFSLNFGTLLAQVKKLLTTKSSFEVEGGGVVCGVRGTKFQVSYDRDLDEFDLKVFEGSVLTSSGGENNLFKSGDQMQFLNGLLQTPQNQNLGPNGGSTQLLNGSDSTAAIGDLSGQIDGLSGWNSDDVFSDPSVGGTAQITIHMNVPSQEAVP